MSEIMKQPKNLTRVVEEQPLSTLQQAEIKRRNMRDKEREMVKGMFKDYECPGGLLEFVFKKYKEDPIEKYSLVDGGIYTLPLGVARHINSDCWYPEHSFAMDEQGKSIARISKKNHRYGFSSMEFMDQNDSAFSNSRIVTVESLTA